MIIAPFITPAAIPAIRFKIPKGVKFINLSTNFPRKYIAKNVTAQVIKIPIAGSTEGGNVTKSAIIAFVTTKYCKLINKLPNKAKPSKSCMKKPFLNPLKAKNPKNASR